MQSYHHITSIQRGCLQAYFKEGLSVANIAVKIGTSKQTVYRELKRNGRKPSDYNPDLAQKRYESVRTKSVRKHRFKAEPELVKWVKERLELFYSPEIIAKDYQLHHSNDRLAFSTIYTALEMGLIEGCTRKKSLIRHGSNRKDRKKYNSVKPEKTIHDRPAEVEQRCRIGDFEGDTIYGGVGKGYLFTAIDRRSRFLVTAVSEKKSGKTCNPAMIQALKRQNIRTLTLDNGVEFSMYKEVENALGIDVYFADRHAPWQRGAIENMNGRLRAYFPLGTDFTKMDPQEIQRVVDIVNNMPRKCLGWKTPRQVYYGL